MSNHLTPEQEQVVAHPLGQHARVLAVAGSGKSTTMAHRIQHLVQECNVRPNAIQVLMFNSLARKQFSSHLYKVGLPETLQPVVHTFHSFSFHVINQMVKNGALPSSTQFWLADKSELIWLTVKRAITNLERAKRFPCEAVDPEDALSAIGLWKGSLIPPDRAGSHTSPYLPLVYQEFEQLRLSENALTFDDFVPMAVHLFEGNKAVQQRYCQDVQQLIVDEYQDINYGQQRLIELLAGTHADVMVVGDDDQTIYEWRGARPNYILHDFAATFKSKPVKDYRLSRSFRFGPLIAQCAANVIACNATRVEKPLVAFQSAKQGFIHIFAGDYSATKEITEQILALTQTDKVPPAEIIVLARLFAQLDNLETEFLSRKIPYRVDGQEPFFKRQEINALLDYVRLARDYRKPLTDQIGAYLLNIANKPSRMLSRSVLSRLLSAAKYRRMSVQQALENAVDDRSSGLSAWQADKVADLAGFLEALQERLNEKGTKAGELLDWTVQSLDYLAYFQDYYGKGEHADEKKYAVVNFIRYVTNLQIAPDSLLDHLAKLDTTQGKPDDELIIFTTIFRTKGLEYDYVVLPQCDDNLLPYLKGERSDIFDKSGRVREWEMSSKEESERRLFYVALTRARKGVLIGASSNPSRFLGEIHLTDTDAVMNAVTHLACGESDAAQALEMSLKAGNTRSNLLNNLILGYLPDLGQMRLAEQLRREWTIPAPTVGVNTESVLPF
jgi:DNA helicase II / ATP-dependent DNA helicase PcrA